MNRHPLCAVTEQDIRTFHQDGVVCLRGMFDLDWVERMSAAIDRAMKAPGPRGREVTKPGEPGRFHMNVFMWRWNADFRALALESPAAEIAGRILEVKQTRFFYDQIFVKEAMTQAITHWHQDLPYWPVRGEQVASVWLALTPVTAETSGVEYVAGSHRWGKFHRAITPDKDAHFDNLDLEVCPDYSVQSNRRPHRIVSFQMEPGDVTVHHPLVIHAASGNRSATQRRLAVSNRYIGADMVWDARPATLVFPGKFELPSGAPLSDDGAFPIAWTDTHPASP